MGFVYLRFDKVASALSAQRALHGRWFAGKMITATFMVSSLTPLSLSLAGPLAYLHQFLLPCLFPPPVSLCLIPSLFSLLSPCPFPSPLSSLPPPVSPLCSSSMLLIGDCSVARFAAASAGLWRQVPWNRLECTCAIEDSSRCSAVRREIF